MPTVIPIFTFKWTKRMLTKPMRVNDKNPIMSMTTNIVGTANVAKICYKYDIKFIYNDYIIAY